MILQFDQAPDETTLAALAARGITVLAAVPENGLLVKTPDAVSFRGLGVRYAGRLDPSDKISPLFTSASPGALVEFHPDVDLNHARALLLGQGIELRENPDLNPHHLLIRATSSAALARISQLDEVAYIFPASDEMVRGVPVRAYAEPLTSGGLVGQYIAANGPGWDGSGLSAATIFYFFSSLTSQVATGSIESEVERAMAEWSKVVQVNWQAGASASAKRTVNILFAAGNHGDGFPFQPGVLAHTFYPAPPNPEPIAGDLHFNEAEPWHVGANMDVFSVALHELGHALGLGHSDNPNDVMYPYYKMVTTLAAGDKAAILTMYAPQTGAPPQPAPAPAQPTAPSAPPPPSAPTQPTSPPPPPSPGTDTTPPALNILSPGGSMISTSSAVVVFTGTASDNVGVASVTWATNTGSSGVASGTSNWSASIPVLVGTNTVTIRATDAAGNAAWRSVVVSRH